MELFSPWEGKTGRLLAVTEEGGRYTLGDLYRAADRLAGALGGDVCSSCSVRTPRGCC